MKMNPQTNLAGPTIQGHTKNYQMPFPTCVPANPDAYNSQEHEWETYLHALDYQGAQNSMKMNPQTNLAGFIFVEF